MSLAEELLADLDQLNEGDELIENSGTLHENAKYASINEIAKLLSTDRLKSLTDRIKSIWKWSLEYLFFTLLNKKHVLHISVTFTEPIELDPEYLLIVDANAMLSQLNAELSVVHKYIRDVYHQRFPELESLVPVPRDYIRAVKTLGNDINRAGQRLEKCDLLRVEEACEMALSLYDHETHIAQYVESRMKFIAPNLSALIGSSTAAKLIGSAGGLTFLSKMPACNILLLGANKKYVSASSTAGFSLSTVERTTGTSSAIGYIAECDLVQSCPNYELRTKIARSVACKCALAARIDHFRTCIGGDEGQKL